MKLEKPYVLAINGGSSSIKFTLYRMGDSPRRRLHSKVDRIDLRGTTLTFNDLKCSQHDSLNTDQFMDIVQAVVNEPQTEKK